jgi:hypothetical protein
MFANPFKGLFARETLSSMTNNELQSARLERFNLRLQREAAEGREATLTKRILRLEHEQLMEGEEK